MWLWRMREKETIGAVFNDEINRVLLVIGFSCRYISVHRRILRLSSPDLGWSLYYAYIYIYGQEDIMNV